MIVRTHFFNRKSFHNVDSKDVKESLLSSSFLARENVFEYISRPRAKKQINISEEGDRACLEEDLRASGERRILEGDHRRSRDHPAPCSWDRDHQRRASDLASLNRRKGWRGMSREKVMEQLEE